MWILTVLLSLVAGFVVGAFLYGFVGALPFLQEGHYLAPEKDLLTSVSVFAAVFAFFWLFLRIFCKTSLRAFFFGAGRKVDRKMTAVIALLWLLGLTVAQFFTIAWVKPAGQDPKLVCIHALLCILFLWIQTTTEEIFFRALPVRILYGNTVPKLPKGIFVAVVSTFIFMALHLNNPEVKTLSGTDMVLTASVYFIAGFMMFVLNQLTGGMEAGIVVHFFNNFFCFVIVTQEVSVVTTPALLVDTAPADRVSLIRVLAILIAYVPVMIYLIRRNALKKQMQEQEADLYE